MTANRAGIIPHPVTAAGEPAVRSPAVQSPAVGPADELPGRQCTRCGAVGTHYLTCPGLRLPSGFRLS
jgi:hypothetical protein